MNALKGIVTATISSLLVAILFAYIFRFPIPMGGMLGPLGDLNPYGKPVMQVLRGVSFAWVFYGIVCGGFLIVPTLGAITGSKAGGKYANSEKKNRMIVLWSFIAGGIPVLFLSTLDYIIGAW